MVANGYGVTLFPEVAIDAEVWDERIKLLRFAAPEPSRTIGLAFRRTSPRKQDFVALGRLVVEAMAGASDDQFARGLKPTRCPPPGSHKNRLAPSPTFHARVKHKAAKPKEEGLPDHGPQGDALVADARRRADSPDGETSALRVRSGRDLPPSAEDRFCRASRPFIGPTLNGSKRFELSRAAKAAGNGRYLRTEDGRSRREAVATSPP
jgi:hypothetical protein